MRRTFAIGDIHGELDALLELLQHIGPIGSDDTLVFLGDYVDRGPQSREVIDFIRFDLPHSGARIVPLRGNHEDAWLRVLTEGWDGFILPPSNGCVACYRSFVGGARDAPPANDEEWEQLLSGSFFPDDVVEWLHELPLYFEDEHAIYVHAGLPKVDGRFLHPSEVEQTASLLWTRTMDFFKNYRGKTCIVGHTVTSLLPRELSSYTPEDPADLWAGEQVIAIDTGCGKGGFLTAIEMPELFVWESRVPRRHQDERAYERKATPLAVPSQS
ncbi:MAG: metallophosphoesterase family protein [Myxococcota bacterium]